MIAILKAWMFPGHGHIGQGLVYPLTAEIKDVSLTATYVDILQIEGSIEKKGG